MDLPPENREELTIFYTDDNNQVQGPFSASHVLEWYQKDCFQDHHRLRITDNGMTIGNKVTLCCTIGELRSKFGDEAAIPVYPESLAFHGFSLKPLSNKHPTNIMKSTKEVRKEDRVSPDETICLSSNDEEETARSKHSRFSPYRNDESRMRRSFSGGSSTSNSTEKFSQENFFGPIPPPKITERGGKVRKTPENSTAAKPYEKKNKEKRKKKHTSKVHLPFYHNSSDENQTGLRTIVAIELASFLRLDYTRMTKNARSDLHKICSEWKIPKRCDTCDCELIQVSNFLTHALSESHIKKCKEDGIRFTFEEDYLKLKTTFENAKNGSSNSNSTEKTPVSYRNTNYADPAAPLHARERCTQS